MDIKKLEEKYKAGNTSLEEEQILFQKRADSESELSAWFQYAQHSKKQASPTLKNDIRQAIEKKTLKFKITFFAAAASILFVALFSIHNSQKEDLSYQEKEAKLQEAIAMVAAAEEEPSIENILYEDELVIIYTSTE